MTPWVDSLYSLIVSCERHGKDPVAYLKDLLTTLSCMTNQDNLNPLLPVNWQPLQ
jgi:transposase